MEYNQSDQIYANLSQFNLLQTHFYKYCLTISYQYYFISFIINLLVLFLFSMTTHIKTPLIHSIVPNLEDYLQDVADFYEEKIAHIIHRMDEFIKIALNLTQLPQHLAMQFKWIQSLPKPSKEQKQIQKLMVRDEIQKFINLKSEVIQYQTGSKYLYPELPKMQRNMNKRKYSNKSESMSSDSEKNQCSPTDSKQSINQICNLLGTLNLQSKTNDQICEQLQSMVELMSGLEINEENQSKQHTKEKQESSQHVPDKFATFDQNTIKLQEIRQIKKSQLFKFQYCLRQSEHQSDQQRFTQIYNQKLLQIKQLFQSHLQNSVKQILMRIEQILLKALCDIKKNDKAYVPIHKISSYFYKINLKFYRSEGVIKSLYKYLSKKIKECIIDGNQRFKVEDGEIQIKTNFRFRFFKHILIENIFYIWLQHAVTDLSKMLKQNISFEDKIPVQTSSEKIEEQTKDIHQENEHHQGTTGLFSPKKGNHSFDNFIM